MSKRLSIPEKTKVQLWVRSGGRCQYDGCNKPLWQDELTMAQMNKSYIAHIYGVNPGSARYDEVQSPKLEKDIRNLMLLCDTHHRLIDHEDVANHPVARLEKMKREHEERIELQTSIQPDKKSHIILFDANIEEQQAKVNWEKAANAMLPNWYPAEKPAIELGLTNSVHHDYEEIYWEIHRKQLKEQFNRQVRTRLMTKQINHFSIFAIAPQPLLIEFGTLLSDIPATEVYQLHREPPNWIWQDHPNDFRYEVVKPKELKTKVALNISLSASIDNSRITKVLGDDVSIWTFRIEEPNNDFLKSREQLRLFRKLFRKLLNEIKATHGQKKDLHIFPAAPVAIAVEIGRVWMPKADLPLCIYDYNRNRGGFINALCIGNQEE